MKHFQRLLAVCATAMCFGAPALQAQGTAHGIAKESISKSDLVEFCASGAHKEKFNIGSCEELVKWFKVFRPGLGITTSTKMAEYIGTLNVEKLPSGTYPVNREVSGKILVESNHPDKRFMRTIQEGDLGLYDNNRGEFEFLLSCGNSPYGGIPVQTAMREQQPLGTPYTYVPPVTRTVEHQELPLQVHFNMPSEKKPSWLRRNGKWLALGAAAGVGGCFAFDVCSSGSQHTTVKNTIHIDANMAVKFIRSIY